MTPCLTRPHNKASWMGNLTGKKQDQGAHQGVHQGFHQGVNQGVHGGIDQFFVCLFAAVFSLLNICTKWKSNEKDWRYQEWNCWLLSWLTLTNLGYTKAAALQRLFSSLYWIIVYTTIFICVFIIGVGNRKNPDDHNLLQVTEPFIFQILLGLTISLGWLSLLLDVITAIVKFRHCRPIIKDYGHETKKKGFWDGFVLLEGLKYFPHCSTISNIRKIQSHL